MKRIRIKMSRMVPVTAEDIPVDGAKKGEKWYKKVVKKLIPPLLPNHSNGKLTEEKKEITAECIQKLIEEQNYEDASKALIELEHKNFSGLEESTLEKELESLYEKLEAEVFRVIKESITSTDSQLLKQAIQAIVEQESEDSKISAGLKNGDRSRPKGWMQTWKECIKQTVEERLQDLPVKEGLNRPTSIIAPLTALGVLFKKDLVHVVTHLRACYPEEFDVCNTYAQHYHQKIKTSAGEITQFELLDSDNYTILFWVLNWYPNEILKDSKLAGHINESQLGNLLPPQVIQSLERSFLNSQAASVPEHMYKALDIEVELWKEGKEPKILGTIYHSELHIDIIQCYNSALQQAAKIQPIVADKLSKPLAYGLDDILRRYKQLFGEYIDKCRTQQFYRATCIAHLNCCLNLRNFITKKESRLLKTARSEMLSLLQQLEESIYESLLQDLFLDLKALFKKMSQGPSLFSYQTMLNVIRTSEDFMEPFDTLMDQNYKVLSGKIHLYLVKEHLTRILKRKLSCKTVQQMQTLANQIRENAELIDSFSADYRSCEDWLKPALLKLVVIIPLQDLSAIELEVAALVEAYPDIRNKQIEAILYIKGNLRRSEIKTILATADTVERRVNEKQKLFALIKTS